MLCYLGLIELTMLVNLKEFDELQERALYSSDKIAEVYEGYIDKVMVDKGLCIIYHNNTKKRKIQVLAYAPLYVDSDDTETDQWNLTDKNIDKLIEKLNKRIRKYFLDEYSLSDFKANMISILTEVNLNKNKAHDYIRVFHKIRSVKYFSPVKYGKSDYEKKENYFGLIGNSSGFEFRVYSEDEESNILRIEVRLTKKSTIVDLSEQNSPEGQIKVIADKSSAIFKSALMSIVPPGDYYKRSDAIDLIYKKIPDMSMKRKMLRFMELITEKKSLFLAEQGVDYRKMGRILGAFDEISVSPITLSKRHKIKFLPSLYEYL